MRARVTGGALRGRALHVPERVRPTEGRVREALFSIWQERVPGARFLDLFAGSGAVGIEALSRGSGAVLFIEQNRLVLRSLERNCIGIEAEAARRRRAVLPGYLAVLAADRAVRFDLIFADPPYTFTGYEALLAAAAPLLADGAEMALEHSARTEAPAHGGDLLLHDHRRYGESALSFYRRG